MVNNMNSNNGFSSWTSLSIYNKPSMHLFCLIMLVNLFSNCLVSSVTASDVDAVISGVNEIASALLKNERSCSNESRTTLSKSLERSVTWMEGAAERQNDTIGRMKEKINNATLKVEDFLKQHYQNSPTEAPKACDLPFESFAGSCFWVHKDPKLSWVKARRRCQLVDADLATPGNELNGFRGMVEIKLGGLVPTHIWLGGQVTSTTDRQYKWFGEGSTFTVNPSEWQTPTETNQGEECTALNGSGGYLIRPVLCTEPGYYVCEKKL